jgi:cytochrome c556
VAGRAELGQAVGAVGGTCKACHDDYRAKDF